MQLSEEESRRIARIRRQRNIVVGLLLGGFVVLVFFISIAKMGH
jgi:hypothetical protein